MFHVVPYIHISRIAVTTKIDAVTAATTSNLVTRLVIQITYDDYFDVLRESLSQAFRPPRLREISRIYLYQHRTHSFVIRGRSNED